MQVTWGARGFEISGTGDMVAIGQQLVSLEMAYQEGMPSEVLTDLSRVSAVQPVVSAVLQKGVLVEVCGTRSQHDEVTA